MIILFVSLNPWEACVLFPGLFLETLFCHFANHLPPLERINYLVSENTDEIPTPGTGIILPLASGTSVTLGLLCSDPFLSSEMQAPDIGWEGALTGRWYSLQKWLWKKTAKAVILPRDRPGGMSILRTPYNICCIERGQRKHTLVFFAFLTLNWVYN